jgi:hypothetical protein
MNTKKTIKQGLGLAAGVLAGNAIVVPMISGGNVPRGIIVGFIAAALVLALFSVIALCQSDKSCGIQKEP